MSNHNWWGKPVLLVVMFAAIGITIFIITNVGELPTNCEGDCNTKTPIIQTASDPTQTAFIISSQINETITPAVISTPIIVSNSTPCIGWEFNEEDNPEGWQNGHFLLPSTTRGGELIAFIYGNNPYWIGPAVLNIDSSVYTTLNIRYRINSAKSVGQFMWTTDDEPDFGDGKLVEYEIFPDMEWHIVTIDLADNIKWHGTITSIRIWPTKVIETGTLQTVQVDYIRFCKPTVQ